MVINKKSMLDFIKKNKILTLTPVFILLVALLFNQPIYNTIGEENYVTAHLIMAFFIVIVSATITIQAWMFFPHTLSYHRLVLGSFFLMVTIMEIFHAITYEGMPFFFGESSSYQATWFYMINRIVIAFALLLVVSLKEKTISRRSMGIAYGLAIVYSLVWILILHHPVQLLPDLVVDGIGTTPLKNSLQYAVLALQAFIILLIVKKYKFEHAYYNMLIMASFYFILSDVMYTKYGNVYDVQNFVGHIFQVFAAYSLLKALYYSSVKEPFLKQQKAEDELKKNERFLHTITTNMGEGLFVCDLQGKLTFMNEEAERMLHWSKSELLGKNICQTVFHKEREPCIKTDLFLNEQKKRWVEEGWFYTKDGTKIPVSYTVTTYKENEKTAGSIIVFENITQQKKDKDLIKYMAYYDELTNLPNRRMFNERLQEAIKQRPEEKTAVLLVDIERFKNIHDTLGHSFGDNLLIAFSNRLRKVIKEEILISRYKGDEFTLLLSPIKNEEEIKQMCHLIERSFNEPVYVQDLHFVVSVNFGVAIYPEHGTASEDLVKNANIAMLQALQQNESYLMYHSSMSKTLQEQIMLESDLHQALEKEELFLVYQPQVNTDTMEVVSIEALLRWNHPTRGLISPGTFIPIAEQSGLIVPIGEWVLRTACQQLTAWHEQGFSNLGISVNLSARQLYQDNFLELVERTLRNCNLLPSYLELEITESMTMINVNYSLKVLQHLKEIGVRIAIDDFGTGYSSLSYLKHLPFDRLKIDQSFIRDFIKNEDTNTIVSMIVSMANHLKMDVIAEGVETVQQLKSLKEINCNHVQGFLFQGPMRPNELSESWHVLQKHIRKVMTDVDTEVKG